MKSGYISIIGKPNVGKSTLINSIFNEKISIITHKPQTTRNKIFKLYKDINSEIIFIDTPGFHKPNNKLDMFLNSEVKSALKKSDICIFITDPTRPLDEEDFEIINQINSFKVNKIICLINKIDVVDLEKKNLRKNEILRNYPNFEIFEVSSLDNENVKKFIKYLKDFLDDQLESNNINDLVYDDKFFINEIIREKILLNFKKEVPHSVAVVTEKISYDKSNNMTKIYSNIIVEKESQKPIIIGKKGNMIKKIGILSREELLNFYDSKIFLELNVKVKKNWRNDNNQIKNFGYKK